MVLEFGAGVEIRTPFRFFTGEGFTVKVSPALVEDKSNDLFHRDCKSQVRPIRIPQYIHLTVKEHLTKTSLLVLHELYTVLHQEH